MIGYADMALPARALFILTSLGFSWQLSASIDPTEQAACITPVEDETSLLQLPVPLKVHAAREAGTWDQHQQAAALESVLPIVWLHIPKTGTSFVNALVHLPGVCNVSHDLVIRNGDQQDEVGRNCSGLHAGLPYPSFLAELFDNQYYFDVGIPEPSVMDIERAHMGLGFLSSQARHKHVFTMFRQPEQRIVSDWNFEWRHPLHIDPNEDPGSYADLTVLDYARHTQGMAVKMFTRRTQMWIYNPLDQNQSLPPTSDEVSLAVKTLRDDVAFVGLTEQWPLSICLLHAMFGGECPSFEFENIAIVGGESGKTSHHNVSELGGWVDEHDGVLYAEATRIFNANLKQYGVNEANCPSACSPRASGGRMPNRGKPSGKEAKPIMLEVGTPNTLLERPAGLVGLRDRILQRARRRPQTVRHQ